MRKTKFYIDPVSGLISTESPRIKGDGSIATSKGGK